MKRIKSFGQFVNEEVNFKSLLAGGMMALLTACHNGSVGGHSDKKWSGDIKVRKIEMGGSKYNYFMVSGLDKTGNRVEFNTDELTFGVGDSIHVDFSKSVAYPLDDKENVSSF